MILLFFFLPGVFGLYENCDYYQELQPKNAYYLYSPDYPSPYRAGTSCRWYAVSPPGTQVFLTCEDMRLPQSPSCNSDALLVSPSGDVDLNDAHAYCGTGGFTIVSNTNKMNIALLTARNSRGGSFLCSIGVEESTIPPESGCECGRRNGVRIVGGQETGVNEFPMMAGLIDFDTRELFCGATIISPNYALTAAHCLLRREAGSIGLLVGDHDTSLGNDTDSADLLVINKFIKHPDYDSETQANDIAIVRVQTPIAFNMKVGPACLPFTNYKQTFAGESVTALGWGTTEFGGALSNTLQKVDLNVLTLNQCRKSYGNRVTRNQLCTYKKDKDACQNDSGGPLMWEDPKAKRLKVLGVISYGIQCATTKPGVNTRVSDYLPWIMEKANDEYCVK